LEKTELEGRARQLLSKGFDGESLLHSEPLL